MKKLCRIIVPGLSIKRDFTAARRRLLAEFPDIQEVVATTAPGTLVVLSSGSDDVDAWLDTLDSLAIRQMGKNGGLRRRRDGVPAEDDSAA